MAQGPEKKVRGTARVAFIANLATIRTELAEGWTAKSIYDRHANKLAGKVSYPQFVRYVRQLRETEPALPIGRASAPTPHQARPKLPPAPPLDVTTPSTPEAGSPADARPDPLRRRTFEHDGQPRQDDIERLITGPKPNAKE